MLSEPEQPQYDHPSSVLYFKVPDLDAAYASLRERGVTFTDAPHLIAEMPDPEGNTLALMSEVPLD